MSKTKKRDEIDNKYKWDLTKIYKTEEEVNKDIELVKEKTEEVLKYKGTIMKDSKTLEEVTEKYFSLIRIMDKLVVYSHMKSDEDKSLSSSEKLMGKIDKFTDEIEEKLAFYTPELLESDYEKVKEYIKENTNLEKYDFMFKDLFREKDHVLSLKEEEMMARLGEILSSEENTFRVLDDVNIKFKNIIDENGKEKELNNSNYTVYLRSNNRDIRKQAFENL